MKIYEICTTPNDDWTSQIHQAGNIPLKIKIKLSSIKQQVTQSTEADTNIMLDEMSAIPVDADPKTVASMLDAANRGLGLANKLSDPVQRKKHVRAVPINLSKIRTALAKFLKIDEEPVVQ